MELTLEPNYDLLEKIAHCNGQDCSTCSVKCLCEAIE